jgi:hypothetical protein
VQPSEFAVRYPPAEPLSRPGDTPDAHRRLEMEDGVRLMPECVSDMPTASPVGDDEARHLWVILPDSVPVILEAGDAVRPPPLALGVVKHTNLTGGGPASCGGEVWLDPADAQQLYLTGGSGRYPAKTPAQLADAVKVFENYGFRVRSAGWSDENDCPERRFR